MKQDSITGGFQMSEYIIMTDSTVDLPKEYLIEELQVPYIPLSYIMDGVTYEDMSGLSGKEFFDKIIDVVTLLGGDLNDAL